MSFFNSRFDEAEGGFATLEVFLIPSHGILPTEAIARFLMLRKGQVGFVEEPAETLHDFLFTIHLY
jgi:hypothetical protein